MKKIISLIALTALLVVPVHAQTSANIRVNSLNALVQLPILSTNMSVMVSGNATIGDGGYAGDFTYDSTSSAATNTYSVLKPAATTGRWIRRNASSYNQFNAVTVADENTYAYLLRRNLQTNVFTMGADNNNVYLQTWAGYALHLNNQGANNIIANLAGGSFGIGFGSSGLGARLDVKSTGTGTTIQRWIASDDSVAMSIQELGSQHTLFVINDAAGSPFASIRSDGTASYINPGSSTFGVGTAAPTSLLSVGGAAAAGTLTATNSLTVGGLAAAVPILAIYTGNSQINFPVVAANGWTNMPMTVTGAGTNSAVTVSVTDGAGTAGISFSAYVSATNTVQISANNPTVNAIDPGANVSYRVVVFQY